MRSKHYSTWSSEDGSGSRKYRIQVQQQTPVSSIQVPSSG